MDKASLVAELDGERHPAWVRIDRPLAAAVAGAFANWPAPENLPQDLPAAQHSRFALIRFLRQRLAQSLVRLGELDNRFAEFSQALSSLHDEAAVQALLFDYLADLGASDRQLNGDRRALDRWLGPDAATERYQRQRTETERELIWLCDRIGDSVAKLLSRIPDQAVAGVWQALKVEAELLQVLTSSGEARLREAGFRALSRSVVQLPRNVRELLDGHSVAFIFRAALDRRQPVWIQCEAMTLIGRLSPSELKKILSQRLTDVPAGDRDDLFFRRRAITALVRAWPRLPELSTLFDLLANDPSAWVRQGLAAALPQLPEATTQALLPRLSVDQEPSVAAQALLVMPELTKQSAHFDLVMAQLALSLRPDGDPFVVRTALHIVPVVYQLLLVHGLAADDFYATMQARLGRLNTTAERVEVRRWSAAAREHLWHLQPEHAGLREHLSELQSLPLGKQRKLSSDADETLLGRMLAVLATDGFGFDLRRGSGHWKVLRDYRWRPRWWRLLHEWRRSASDKRQSYSHVRGRVYFGNVHVPAPNVAEVSQTKVPGEPLQIADEGGYRPYLPLPDQLLSCLDQGWPIEPLRMYTAEGVTWITPPATLWQRAKTKWRLSKRFDEIARLRNWQPTSPFGPEAYLAAVAELGFRIELKSYTDAFEQPLPIDPKVQRFFPAIAPVWLPELWRDAQTYFYSVYQNTLGQLLGFVAIVSSLFFGGHLWANWRFRLARKKIPLVVGGWGTRGKSGTERLKAGLFSALGYRVVSKTTGCEAMFMYAHHNRPLREMFLFRPYDKATIWEQLSLVRLSADLKAEVFLWECMGLTPRYIRILQRQWMRDDVATICNCFPDHEDIQGPAGVDIPQVMQMFVPRQRTLVTSEENMLPYLREAAAEQGTQMHCVNWLQANLLPPDILSRFPYEEHPYNIALVTRLGELLGVAADFTLKEMADRVVPDLGVLKAYPWAPVRGRQLQFINGCSANERHGTLSNWQRMGLAAHSLDLDPEVWTTTVINNRADRIARSQVFAAVVVRDIGADRHLLIGNNLDGFMSYVRDAFDRFATQIDWNVTDDGRVEARQKLHDIARRWRIPTSVEQVEGRLLAMLDGLEVTRPEQLDESSLASCLEAIDDPQRDRLMAQWHQDRAEQQRFIELHDQLGVENLQQPLTTQLWNWLEARFEIVSDYHASGNQVVERLCEATPPGLKCRAMGLQNIKGTGLDFVYRWQAWGDHHQWCEQLAQTDPGQVAIAAKSLASSQDYGWLESEFAPDAIERCRQSPQGQNELLQADLQAALDALERQLGDLDDGQSTSESQSRWFAPLLTQLEALLDSGDAVKRRRRANQIYRDLAAERISHARAAKELKALTSRQKGGWLARQWLG